MYLVGEALIGNEPEIAHIDLIIGEKKGPVGDAFASGLAHLSMGHTPMLAVIRPNLPTKPATLIVPKVTVKGMEQAAQIFGPAQSAVAKAVADAVEEGIIPRDKAEEWVLVVSVFIHPEAKDYSRIYRYNYGATKLAIQRAMEGFPSVDKVLYEKDRSTHPVMGYRHITKLFDPPYLQVALDIPDLEQMLKVVKQLPRSDHLIIEAGTPLIKRYGIGVVQKIREINPNVFVVADLKTLDTGNLEVRIAADEGADAVVISGLATHATLEKAIAEAKKTGLNAVIDMLNVDDPISLLKSLPFKPDIVELHRAIDTESRAAKHKWIIADVKKVSDKMLVAVAGGIKADNAKDAINAGADILIVGRAITNAKDVEGTARQFLKLLKEEIDQFRVMTDF